MLTACVVVAVDCPRGSCEVLQAAVRRSVGRCTGDLSDEDVPHLVGRGGPTKLEGVAGFLQNIIMYVFIHIYMYIDIEHQKTSICVWLPGDDDGDDSEECEMCFKSKGPSPLLSS